ncbi:MAG: hypothetical protein MUF15_18975 [Acidobacteria bacterium]|jgi:hypothetical protein|nr:hypothetical protein [Acidobacteriota bacterium]
MMKKKFKISICLIGTFILLILIFQGGCKKSSGLDGGTVYFLVSEMVPVHGDSYILPLTKPEDIAAAENIINGTAPAQIVVAEIDYGNGKGFYKNMDLLDPNKRVWSWHVKEFLNFADFTIEILDGWPTYVEENLDQWIQNTNGRIGFWSYTVTRKVDPSEMH